MALNLLSDFCLTLFQCPSTSHLTHRMTTDDSPPVVPTRIVPRFFIFAIVPRSADTLSSEVQNAKPVVPQMTRTIISKNGFSRFIYLILIHVSILPIYVYRLSSLTLSK